MAANVIWPSHVLRPTAGKSKVTAATIGGGRSISGREQVVANDAGYWRATLANIVVATNAHIAAWNAIEAIVQGRSGTVMVPALDCHRAPWPIVNGDAITPYGSIPHSDGAFFSDGAGYYQPVIDATAYASISARGVTARIRILYGSVAAGHFSVGERMYRIMRVTASAADGVATIYDVTFWPPAREAIVSGAVLNFDEPRFRARLATDNEMEFDPALWRFGNPTLNFTEDV